MSNKAATPGKVAYQNWRDEFLAAPQRRAIYAEEAAKSELWLQLVTTRQKAGLTQADMAKRLGVSQSQVARIEKRGYDAYTLNTLRRYVAALGEVFSLEVTIHTRLSASMTGASVRSSCLVMYRSGYRNSSKPPGSDTKL